MPCRRLPIENRSKYKHDQIYKLCQSLGHNRSSSSSLHKQKSLTWPAAGFIPSKRLTFGIWFWLWYTASLWFLLRMVASWSSHIYWSQALWSAQGSHWDRDVWWHAIRWILRHCPITVDNNSWLPFPRSPAIWTWGAKSQREKVKVKRQPAFNVSAYHR